MRIDLLDSQPDAALAAQLERFESQFRYPLGPGRSFRISHGNDYTRFFRAIGQARCFVARDAARVLGVVSVSLCGLHQPNGETITAAYFSDLKIASPAMGPVLLSLLCESIGWARQHAKHGFSVVMDGTPRPPERYTGRMGIPRYVELAKLMILRIPADSDWRDGETITPCSIDEARAVYQRRSVRKFRTGGGYSGVRSLMPPQGLMLAGGEACAVLEDTRSCKLLFSKGEASTLEAELVSAHLGCFAYSSPRAAAALIHGALRCCRELRIPALFVAVPFADAEALERALSVAGIVQAPATVFGFGFPQGADWLINSSEI